jgi:hypothetical protein
VVRETGELLPAKNVDNQIRNSRDRKVRSKRASGLKNRRLSIFVCALTDVAMALDDGVRARAY